jgi:hypothetical protein
MRQWLTPRTLVAACLVLGMARIVSTYPVFTQTWDEPAHVAAGMQWLDQGRYTYEPLHPPLARVMVALGPRLAGIRSAGHENVWLEGNSILYAGDAYERNLSLARLGVLPFFVLAGLVVFAWTRRVATSLTAVAAVLLFSTLPPVLAHAGIATTDLAVAATVAWAAYALTLWLSGPTRGRSLILGLACGAAFLSKFSALLFLPAATVVILLCRRGGAREGSGVAGSSRTSGLRFALLALLLTVWAGYQFELGPLLPARPDASEPQPESLGVIERVAAAPVFPAPPFFEGLGELAAKNRAGHKAYLLGEVRHTGWWYFFPVALGVKTPIAFLLLCAAGVLAAWRASPSSRRALIEPAAIAFAILLVCLPGRINIGLRHVLPVYPFLSITAAIGLAALVRARWAASAGPIVAAALLVWHLVSSAAAHPDYLAYFNAFGGARPEEILVDSDLDNGQDLARLADTLRARGIDTVWMAYAGSATVAEHDLPEIRWLEPHRPERGWIAASLYSIKLGSLGKPGHDDFAWLERHRPVARVGRSILLYHIQ